MIHVYDTPELVAEAGASIAAWRIASPGASNIGLAGGSTPVQMYRLLSDARLDWSDTTLWLGDERWVPPNDPDSNALMARSSLGAAASRLVAPDTTLDDPKLAAQQYTDALGTVFAPTDGRPDLVFLGIGDDGHTASLFPDSGALEDTSWGYAANWVETKAAWRLTATFPLLWSADTVVFLVTGEGKSEMLKRILIDHEPFPSQRVSSGVSRVMWLLDTAAASKLR